MTTPASDSIEKAFKELVKEKPYKKITVSEICKRANISRKAFYANYSDKEAIVDSLFHQHVVQPLHDVHRLFNQESLYSMADTFSLRMYESLYAEREYYISLIGPMRGNDDTFIRVVTWAIYNYNISHLPTLAQPSADWKLDYMAYFFASSQAMYMQKWISDKMLIPPKDLADLYCSMTMPFWKELYSKK